MAESADTEKAGTRPADTPTATPTGRVRSVPRLVFTDAEAGALEFPSSNSRSFNYFEPQRLKATVYEDVTVDVQPDPARYLTQDWVYGFADRPGGYPADLTAAKSSDWHWFRDPNQEWEQTIYRNNARLVRQVEQNIANARNEGAFERWSPDWAKTVETHVGAWMHAEHGLGMHVFLPAQRDAPTNMINNAMAVGAAHKLRFAQDLILYNLTLSEEIDGFEGGVHKQTWQQDPIWQSTRELTEQLTGIRDWSEQLFATTVVFEPLVGELFRSGFVMQVAAPHGDFVTPTIIGAGEADAARDQRAARVLFRMLSDDAAHGPDNREIMQGWLETYVPRAVEAGRQLQPIWSQLSDKVIRFEDSFERSRARMETLLGEIGLEAPKEVQA